MDEYRPSFYRGVVSGNDGYVPIIRNSPTNALRERDFTISYSKHRYGMYIVNVTRKMDGKVRVSRCLKSDMKKEIGILLKSLGCSGSIDWEGEIGYGL